MDCRKAQQNIDLHIDGMLDNALAQQLERHIASCTRCQKALDDTLRLKRVLSELGDLQPPAGLVQSAIKKARRRPVYTYLTAACGLAAAAVVIAVVLQAGKPDAARGLEMGAPMAAAESSQVYATQIPEEDYDFIEQQPSLFATDANRSLLVYETESEFAESYGRGYYRPAALPEGSALESITDDGYSVVFKYHLDSGDTFEFGWIVSSDDYLNAEFKEEAAATKHPSNSKEYEQHGQNFWVSSTDYTLDINAYCEAEWKP